MITVPQYLIIVSIGLCSMFISWRTLVYLRRPTTRIGIAQRIVEFAEWVMSENKFANFLLWLAKKVAPGGSIEHTPIEVTGRYDRRIKRTR